ncbi:MAG: hypothetical protein KAK01_08095 [Candidatus Marinimicrobia bacterium]|nr:hypothetical protein [Candidatus Neomarinimicrobiota bacterium]
MHACAQKLKSIKCFFLSFTGTMLIIIPGCSMYSPHVGLVRPPEVLPSAIYRERMEIHRIMNGRGSLVYSGQNSGRMSFDFNCVHDSVYIQFKDILNRRVLFLQIEQENSQLWDILNNQRYSKANLPNNFTLLASINSDELVRVLWGVAPELNSQSIIDFTYDQSDVGSVIKKAVIQLSNNQRIEIHIFQRQWGRINSNLISKIPNSVPLITPYQ